MVYLFNTDNTGHIKFIFEKEIKIYFFFSYKFIDRNENPIPLNELEKFGNSKKRIKNDLFNKYLFNWDDVIIGNNAELIKFLKGDLEIEWAENADVKKSTNNETITVTDKNNNANLITVKLNEAEKKVNLEISGKRYEYILKKENGKLNIYKKSIKFDERKTNYSFFDSFSTHKNMPLVISMSPEKIKNEVKDNVKGSELLNIQIRLTHHGIASVRVLFDLSSPNEPKTFDNNTNSFISTILQQIPQAKKYADATYKKFIETWNKNSKYQLDQNQMKHVDLYMAIFSGEIKVEYNDRNDKFPLSYLKREKVPQNIRKDVEKMLVGLAITSYLWPKYSKDFVQKFIKSDTSTSENEFQFVEWRNAFIYYEGKNTNQKDKLPAKYSDYLYDMLLGLEILFIIRSSLQLLEDTLNKRQQAIIQLEITNPLLRLLLKLPGTGGYLRYYKRYKTLKILDRRLLSIVEWRKINRYGLISHFHNFLKRGLQTMRIDDWLTAIGNRIELLRNIIKVQSDVVTATTLVFLTVGLLLLTGLLVFLEIIHI